MKIEPVKHYKKPNYAMRIASIITAAGSLAGCSTSPQLEGDAAIVDTEPATTASDVELVGMIEPTEETCVELDGDIAVLPEETTVMHNGEVLTEEMMEEIRNRKTTTTPAVTTTDNARIAVPGMADIAEETAPAVTTKRRTQIYTTATTTELEIDGMITTAATTTEVTIAGVPPIYTEETTTTEPELAGDVVIDGGIMPYME